MLIYTEKVLIFSLRNFNEIFRENVNYDNIKSPKNTRVSPSTQNMHFQKNNRKGGQIDLSPAFLELRIEQALYMKRLHISRLYVTLPSDILKNISVFKTNSYNFRRNNNFERRQVHFVCHDTQSLSISGPENSVIRLCSPKQMFLKNSQYSQESTCVWSLFLINLQTLRPSTLLKRDSNTDVCVNVAKFLRTVFLQKIPSGCF